MAERFEMKLLEETRAFMLNRVVLTAGELDLFDIIGGHPDTPAAEIASSLGLHERATTRLLDCLTAFGYLTKTNRGGYRLTDKGSLLTSDHPQTILPMVKHHAHLWKNWSHLTEIVRRGVNPFRESVTHTSETQKAFIEAMHVIGRTLAQEIVASYDASPCRKLLDIGGASGTYTIAFLTAYPQMEAVLFDLPSVIPLARERVNTAGLTSRVQFVAGDFSTDELPRGCDLALLSAIVHQNSPQENDELFLKIFRALEPGGRLLIRDHIMDEERTSPPAGALFALNMLAVTEGGDTYTFAELAEGLRRANFCEVAMVRRGDKMDCLVEARKAP